MYHHPKIQRSRLNSLTDLHKYCYTKRRSLKELRNCLDRQRLPEDTDIEWLDDGEGEEEITFEVTSFAIKAHRYSQIQEYVKFKAARTIQRIIRGWLVRTRIANMTWAAIVIQRNWRAFYYQNWFYRKVENLLQERIEEHYHKSAIKIQALYRGWWTRQNIHDHTRLMQLQLTAGQDLLHCIAFKLHHLLRTYQIPGIYSLKNSKALSKVEKLLATMTFKQCNSRARAAYRSRLNEIKDFEQAFLKSRHATKLPYRGPDIYNICEPKCVPLYSQKDADRRMSYILYMYEKNMQEDARVKKIRIKKEMADHTKQPCLPQTTFCGDVVRSMKKWNIVTAKNYTIEPDVLQSPENVANFLNEVSSKWSLMHPSCYCREENIPVLKKCSDTKNTIVFQRK